MDVAGHGHGDSHRARSLRNQQSLTWALLLVAGYMVAEIVGGLVANSLALLADAGHMLSDAAALSLSLFAIWIARRPPSPRRTYGYYRAEILAALANGATLIAIAIVIFIEAVKRFGTPPEVQGLLMTAIAVGGLAVNVAGLWILSHGRSDNLNVRGAWLHMLTDALGSVAVIVAGAGVWAFGWNWIDPVASLAIALLVIHSAWALLAEAVAILMEGTPGHIDIDDVRNALIEIDGVEAVHDLHIWTITTGYEALSAHVVVGDIEQHDALLSTIRQSVHDRFGIDKVTIQLEPVGFRERHVRHGSHD
jgi:cobalt-zinc-cadmium efflux system protein